MCVCVSVASERNAFVIVLRVTQDQQHCIFLFMGYWTLTKIFLRFASREQQTSWITIIGDWFLVSLALQLPAGGGCFLFERLRVRVPQGNAICCPCFCLGVGLGPR